MSSTNQFRAGALALLIVILGAAVLLWSIPTLGGIPNLQTGVVLSVAPDSPAAIAGLRTGDRITQIYGYPWAEINTRTPLLPLPWREGTPTAVTVERDGSLLTLLIRSGAPSPALQVEKLLRLVIALVCWVTGYLLGTSPRAVGRELRWTGWFWVLLGASLGVYTLAQTASYVVATGMLWFQCTVLAPAAVALHSWYPPRPRGRHRRRQTVLILVAAIGVGQAVALA